MGADQNYRDRKLWLKFQVRTPTLEPWARCEIATEELHQHKKALGTHENKHGSKHKEIAQDSARYTNTG